MPRAGESTTVVFWNIRAGGGPTRAQPILLELISHAPDVVVLAECRPTFTGQLTAALRERGLVHRLAASVGPRTNHLAVVSRSPIARSLTAPSARLITATTREIGITACHIPDASDRTRRLQTLAKVHAAAADRRDQPHLILGDINADRALHPQRDAIAIGRLAALGYADVWLRQGGDPADPTWLGPRDARARIDHAYASKPLVSQVESMAQIHAPRDAGLSDHSLLKLRFIHKSP